MKVLVDECVDWRLMRELPDHEARSVKQAGLEQLDDGDLLRAAAREFDVFLTVDKDLPYQQNIRRLDLAVVILRAKTTRLVDLLPLVGMLHEALATATSGDVRVLSWRDLQ